MDSLRRFFLNKAWTLGAMLLTACATGDPEQAVSTLDWPQWLGPDRSGKSTETAILRTWPPEGPREIWRVAVGGGYAGLAISQDKLYT